MKFSFVEHKDKESNLLAEKNCSVSDRMIVIGSSILQFTF